MTDDAAVPTTHRQIPLASILTDLEARSTQVRLAHCDNTVTEYAAAIKRGARFPPVKLVADLKGRYYIADGWHRVLAAREAGKSKTIEAWVFGCIVGHGPLASALRYALRSNADHGLKLSPGDQRNKARRALIELPEMRGYTDRKIEGEIGVSNQTVSRARNDLVREGAIPHKDTGLTADALLPDDYVGLREFRAAFKRDPAKYHEVRAYLAQLTAALNPRTWKWDADTRRVIHAGLRASETVAFSIEGNPAQDGLPRDMEPHDDPDWMPPREPFTDDKREHMARIEQQRRFDEARKRLEGRKRADLTAAAATLAKYRNVPDLWNDIRDFVTHGGPLREQDASEF